VGEITKSLASYWLAVSLFSIQQIDNLLHMDSELAEKRSIHALETAVDATTDQLGSSLRSAFRMVDDLQRGVIGLTFGLLNPFPRKEEAGHVSTPEQPLRGRVITLPSAGHVTRFPEEVNNAS
jgi:hypothetical protein